MNFYQLLQVDQQASEDVIKAAHKAQMRKIHPDQANSAENRRRAQELGEARQTLLDREARRKYDATLQDQARATEEARNHAQEHQAETYEEESPRRRPRRAAPARPPHAPREQPPYEANPLLDFGRGLLQAGLRGANRKVAPLIEDKAEQAGEMLGEQLAALFRGGSR